MWLALLFWIFANSCPNYKQRRDSLDNVCKVHHNTCMSKESAITIRLSSSLKKRLEQRARSQRRSLSSQVVYDIERLSALDHAPREGGAFVGMFSGARAPSNGDIREVRKLLWGRLADD